MNGNYPSATGKKLFVFVLQTIKQKSNNCTTEWKGKDIFENQQKLLKFIANAKFYFSQSITHIKINK